MSAKISNSNWASKGFSLVELMITMAISGVIISLIYSVYIVQQRTSIAQEEVTEMQQNLRAGLLLMTREFRMIGLDQTDKAGAGFVDAKNDALVFTVDLNGDGDVTDTGENIGYDLYTTTTGIPVLGRISSSSTLSLTEPTTGHFIISGHQPLAENIEKLEFCYLEKGNDDWSACTVTPVDPDKIRSIRISMLARADKPDPNFKNSKGYCPGSNPYDPATGQCTNTSGKIWGPTNDHFRRRLLVTSINCRNMGLLDK